MMQPFASPEAMQNWLDVMGLLWKNFDDFVEKYDSKVNPESAAKRLSLWTSLDILGYQFKSGLIDSETVYSTMRGIVVNSWLKFGPIIKEYKERSEFPSDAYFNFEYMANELARMYKVRDPSYKGARSMFKPEEYDEVFRSDKQTQ
jgi:hypothetical protein